ENPPLLLTPTLAVLPVKVWPFRLMMMLACPTLSPFPEAQLRSLPTTMLTVIVCPQVTAVVARGTSTTGLGDAACPRASADTPARARALSSATATLSGRRLDEWFSSRANIADRLPGSSPWFGSSCCPGSGRWTASHDAQWTGRLAVRFEVEDGTERPHATPRRVPRALARGNPRHHGGADFLGCRFGVGGI